MLPPPPVAAAHSSVGFAIKRSLGLLLILAATPAWSAIAIDQVKSTDRSRSSTSITSPSFSTTAANELLLAFISSDARSAGITVTGVTGAGLTWVPVRRTNTQLGNAEIWRAFAASTLSNVTVRATLSQSVSVSITVVTFTGTDTTGTSGSGAIGATASASARSGAPGASLVTTRNGSWVFGVGNDWDNASARTVPAGQAMVHQYLASTGDTFWVQRQNAPTPSSGTTVTINDTAPASDRYNLTIVEVLAAPPSGLTYSVSGRVAPTPLVSGSTVTLTQGATTIATATADTNGNYSFLSVANGAYTVTPSKAGVDFSPPFQSVTVNGDRATVPDFTATAQAWTVSGTITPAALAAGAGVTLSQGGTTIATTTVDGTTGNYSFSNVAGGTYTVTPAKAGVNFNPTSRSVTVSGNTTANFTATTQTWTVSGTVSPSSSGVGTLVALDGTASGGSPVHLSATAGSSGTYSISGVLNGSYTVTPSKNGYTFNPPFLGVNIANGNGTANFTATLTQTYGISGSLSPAAQGSGATIALSGTASATTTANSSGNYAFSGLASGSYTVTPSKSGFNFTPASQDVTVNGSSVTGVNFSVAPQPGVISGTISPASNGAGATVTLSGAANGSTTANSSGNYSFTGLGDGTYTVTPSKPNVIFNPTSQTVTLSGSGVVGVDFSASAFTPNLTVDGSITRQTMDGMGVNINVNSWRGGELRPALDLLVDTNGSSLFRVIRDPMTWVTSESQIAPLHNLDPDTLGAVYEAPAMQDIWYTIDYLNQKGITGNQILLNFMGRTPTWLGGGVITAGKESEFATMVASLMYYGRTVKNLNFTLLSPLNESDLGGGTEGPSVSSSQYRTILHDLVLELDYMGLSAVRLVGPDTAGSGSGYISTMMADSTIANRLDHIAFHTYGGSTSPGAAYAQHNYWLTETAGDCGNCDNGGTPSQGEWGFARQTGDYLLGDISNNWAAVLIYDGYDSFYYHHNSFGYWGLLAYDQTSGTYTPRKRFYVNSQLNAFIRPGAVQIGETDSISSLTALAFYQAASGKVSIVGHNSSSSAVTINGQLKNLPVSVSSFAYYQTNTSTNLQRGADVPVGAGGNFALSVPADTFFSLSN